MSFRLFRNCICNREKPIVPITKKDRVFEVLSDKKSEVATYMNKERLSFKKKKDMLELLAYYNQL